MDIYKKMTIWEYAEVKILVHIWKNCTLFFSEFSIFIFIIFKTF